MEMLYAGVLVDDAARNVDAARKNVADAGRKTMMHSPLLEFKRKPTNMLTEFYVQHVEHTFKPQTLGDGNVVIHICPC